MRSLIVVPLAVGAIVLATGCRNTGPLDVTFRLTGDPGATADVHYRSEPDSDGTGGSGSARAQRLPWRLDSMVNRGPAALEATPSKGVLTCTITVKGREVVKATGRPGRKVRCSGDIGR
ncbi:MAG: hypothetical protein JWO79_2817 [Actinomycetia bacterium]|jgi:hypothetical protein|nr:hypothetical protein [Actinomycetes bacterium]MDQ1654109.1 rane protein [Cryptosporangiaceae bacterium]